MQIAIESHLSCFGGEMMGPGDELEVLMLQDMFGDDHYVSRNSSLDEASQSKSASLYEDILELDPDIRLVHNNQPFDKGTDFFSERNCGNAIIGSSREENKFNLPTLLKSPKIKSYSSDRTIRRPGIVDKAEKDVFEQLKLNQVEDKADKENNINIVAEGAREDESEEERILEIEELIKLTETQTVKWNNNEEMTKDSPTRCGDEVTGRVSNFTAMNSKVETILFRSESTIQNINGLEKEDCKKKGKVESPSRTEKNHKELVETTLRFLRGQESPRPKKDGPTKIGVAQATRIDSGKELCHRCLEIILKSSSPVQQSGRGREGIETHKRWNCLDNSPLLTSSSKKHIKERIIKSQSAIMDNY